jgi:hypothetical protein
MGPRQQANNQPTGVYGMSTNDIDTLQDSLARLMDERDDLDYWSGDDYEELTVAIQGLRIELIDLMDTK